MTLVLYSWKVVKLNSSVSSKGPLTQLCLVAHRSERGCHDLFNYPRCKELILGVIDDAIYYTSRKDIGGVLRTERLRCWDHMNLGEPHQSHLATTGFLTPALE